MDCYLHRVFFLTVCLAPRTIFHRLTVPVPIKEVHFQFPTDYGDTGELGDRLWNEMMPREFPFMIERMDRIS